MKEYLDNIREEMLEEDAIKYVFQNSQIMWILIKADGTILSVNKRWEEVLGYNAGDMEGKPFWDFISEEYKKEGKELFFRRQKNKAGYLDEEAVDNYINVYLSKKGEPVELVWTKNYEDFNGTLIASCYPLCYNKKED